MREDMELASRSQPSPTPKSAGHDGGDMVEDALASAGSWLERWAVHAGACRGGALCTCGLTAIRSEVGTALAALKETP